MPYRWRKSELRFKQLCSFFLKDPYYTYLVNSLLKQANLKHPKSHLEKYDLNAENYSFSSQKKYFYEDIDFIPAPIITKLKDLYLTWEDISYFKQKFILPERIFTIKDLMCMLDDVINNINNPDILRVYRRLIKKSNHTYNIQDGNKNRRGELIITGMTIFDYIFNKNYINLLREYNIEDFTTLVHETMHAILNILLVEAEMDYEEGKLFLEVEGNFGTALSWDYLKKAGYSQDVLLSKLSHIDSTLFLSLALFIGDLYFSSDEREIEQIAAEANKIIAPDRQTDIEKDLSSYICFPAVDLVSNIIDYLTVLEIMKRPLDEATNAIIDIRLHNNNDLIATLKKHHINFLDDDFATLKKEFNHIK